MYAVARLLLVFQFYTKFIKAMFDVIGLISIVKIRSDSFARVQS